MYKIVKRKQLNSSVVLLEINAPFIARKAEAGQFIIFRIDEYGERIPLTIADYDRQAGTITLIFQIVGSSTRKLSALQVGETILDIVGPLGTPTQFPENAKKVAVIGGGVGTAIAYPSAKALHQNGVKVDVVAGFREKEIVILEKELAEVSDKLIITTDDGSYGKKGFVTDALKELIEDGGSYDLVIAIGPVLMMKFVSKLTKEYNIKTLVSLNPIMIDGTGMCGGCRVTVDGKIKYACVDGPDFDGHSVDFDELLMRNSTYIESEKRSEEHYCKLLGGNLLNG